MQNVCFCDLHLTHSCALQNNLGFLVAGTLGSIYFVSSQEKQRVQREAQLTAERERKSNGSNGSNGSSGSNGSNGSNGGSVAEQKVELLVAYNQHVSMTRA